MKKLLLLVTIIALLLFPITAFAVVAEEEATGEEVIAETETVEETASLSAYDQFREWATPENLSDYVPYAVAVGMAYVTRRIKTSAKTSEMLSVNLESGTTGLKDGLKEIISFKSEFSKLREENTQQRAEIKELKDLVVIGLDKLDSQSTAFMLVYGSMINNEELRTSVTTTLSNGLALLTAPKKQLVAEKMQQMQDKITEVQTESNAVTDEINQIIGG